MANDDIKDLIGRYATGTLTAEEREGKLEPAAGREPRRRLHVGIGVD